jgi:putative endonuclease
VTPPRPIPTGAKTSSVTNETRAQRGARGEELALEFLAQRGYRLVVRNHRCPRGEIDIVAWDGDVLCFVEVRARTPSRFGTALETIDARKMHRIVCAARDFLRSLPAPWPAMRFDAVGVQLTQPPSFELVQGAFEA